MKAFWFWAEGGGSYLPLELTDSSRPGLSLEMAMDSKYILPRI